MKKTLFTNWKVVAIASATLMASAVARPASAITTSNNFTNVTNTVTDVSEGALEDDTEVRFFEEQTNFELGSDLTVDASSDDIGTVLSEGSGTNSTISEGTTVNSFYFHYDQEGTSGSSTTGSNNSEGEVDQSFTVNFNQPIAGIIFSDGDSGDNNLDNSDSIVGRDDVTYSTTNRGFDGDEELEFVDQNTLEVQSLTTTTGVDDFRVVTQPVPFEAEGTMGVVALGGYLFYRHRKKRKQALSEQNSN